MLGKFGKKPGGELNTTLNRRLCARGNNAVKKCRQDTNPYQFHPQPIPRHAKPAAEPASTR